MEILTFRPQNKSYCKTINTDLVCILGIIHSGLIFYIFIVDLHQQISENAEEKQISRPSDRQHVKSCRTDMDKNGTFLSFVHDHNNNYHNNIFSSHGFSLNWFYTIQSYHSFFY